MYMSNVESILLNTTASRFITIQYKDTDDESLYGVVAEQNPAANSQVKDGEKVYVTLYRNKKIDPVPIYLMIAEEMTITEPLTVEIRIRAGDSPFVIATRTETIEPNGEKLIEVENPFMPPDDRAYSFSAVVNGEPVEGITVKTSLQQEN